MTADSIAILGAGSWGTALAIVLARDGRRVRLWARRAEQREELRSGGNEHYLPGVSLPPGIEVHDAAAAAVHGLDHVVLAVPTAAVEETARQIASALGEGSTVVAVAKGFERESGRRISEVLMGALARGPAATAVLLGPSHAEEVAAGHPTAIVLAGGRSDQRSRLQESLSTASLRVYTNDDLIGVETAAALKNVLAIAAGICDGLGLGDNTKGALLTRGLAEISRLGVALGGRRETFYGLSGIGDVITTCLSRHSRNRALGERVGRGEMLDDARRAIGQVVEGIETTHTAVALAARHGVSMPITVEVDRVLFGDKPPAAAIEDLMRRSLKPEWEGGGDPHEGADHPGPTPDPSNARRSS